MTWLNLGLKKLSTSYGVLTRYLKGGKVLAVEDWKRTYIELLADSDITKQNLNIEKAQILKAQNFPKVLYSYGRFTKENYALQNLKDGKFYLQSADRFNDLYDCHQRIDMGALLKAMPLDQIRQTKAADFAGGERHPELKTGADVFKYGKQRLQEMVGEEKAAAAMEAVDAFVSQMNDKSMREKIARIQAGTKVCCFCSRRIEESFLMWSHYADYHRGFCVAYDPHEIGLPKLQPVIYTDTFFDGTPHFQAALEGKQMNTLLTFIGAMHKHPDWAYEQEWRIVIPQGGEEGSAIEAPAPKALFAGARIEADNLVELQKVAAEKKIPLYRMELDPHRYWLHLVEMKS